MKLGPPISKVLITLCISLVAVFTLVTLVTIYVKYRQEEPAPVVSNQFPVTVDPIRKIILEDQAVNSFLEGPTSPLQASAFSTIGTVLSGINLFVEKVTNLNQYQNLALAGGKIVTIVPGLRKEEVANRFGYALGWTSLEKKEFLKKEEGLFSPGTYFVEIGGKPAYVHELVDNKFNEEILSRYGTSTEKIVPLKTALTIASLIQRETLETKDMRLVSGIIWNRLFLDMNLQLDATLQYVKASKTTGNSWWPSVVPADKFRKSPYNTYQNQGLPPTPISNVSVAAVLAALNPIKTDCIFYFHDKLGDIHCTKTYPEHVALIKRYYGKGR